MTDSAEPDPERSRDDDQDDRPRRGPSLAVVVREAREQLEELTGNAPEAVSAVDRTEDGWTVVLEVVELAKVPDSMSLLASYEVQVGHDGDLAGYRRVRRYARGQAD